MKMAILGTRGIPARYGGFETFAEQLATRLVKRGHSVTVFCQDHGTGVEEYKGVKLRHIRVPQLGPVTTLAFDAACLWQARAAFDVIYMLGYGASVICWLPRIFGSHVWINMDGLEWARSKWNWFARAYLRFAERLALLTPDRIIGDAAAIKVNLLARYKKLPSCDVIPYGCDSVNGANPLELEDFGLRPGSYYLVVCRFEPENHLKEIIEGFLRSDSRERLVLVGDASRKSSYVQSLTAYQDARLLFTGPVYDASKIQALRFFCRAYLHGHSVGGTNPSLLEAMGCGNLIIAHDNVFNREVLGNSGLFFSTSFDISSAVNSVNAGKVDSGKLRAEAVERIKKFYTWERITDSYCELLAIVSTREPRLVHSAPLSAGEATAEAFRSGSY